MNYSDCRIPLCHIPFSRYGAYLAVSSESGDKGLILHDVRKSFGEDQVYRIYFVDQNRDVDIDIQACPECITVRNGEKMAKIYIQDEETLVVDSIGLDLVLRQTNKYGYGVEAFPYYHIINIHHHLYTSVYVQEGEGRLCGPVRKGNGPEVIDVCQNLTLRCLNGKLTAAVRINEQERKFSAQIYPEDEIQKIKREWVDFLDQLPDRKYANIDYVVLTWYNLWSSFVKKSGNYHQDTMIMSKKGMCAVWSWDHCFNALAMAEAGMEHEAWNQFMAPFLHQSENGCLPDMWRPNAEITWSITKPPIHGWCMEKLIEQINLSSEQLLKVYDGLKRWTQWWMEYRDYDQDGIPAYPMGCDCGWDNTTVFDYGYFVESPDLPSYLVLQMRCLEKISKKLESLTQEDCEKEIWKQCRQEWSERKSCLLRDFYSHCWENEGFVSKKNSTHEVVASDSLLNLMPLVLGEELGEKQRKNLTNRLIDEFLTEYGLATEKIFSRKYESDGYWRGPIWAPVTYLLVDGLYRGGEREAAYEIAERFCRMLEERAGGNYENFDAKTGKGLRAPGYTWTASVYLLLCWQYRRN